MTVSRDFRLQVFFHESVSTKPQNIPLGPCQHIDKYFSPSSLKVASSLLLFQLFATEVVDAGGKFTAVGVDTDDKMPPMSLTPGANLPPLSTTLAVSAANLSPGSLTLVANLPLVSLIPVVHLDLRISPRIFKKFE